MPRVAGEKKRKQTVALDPGLWRRIRDLVGVYGNTPSDVIAYVVLNWFATSQEQIRQMKASQESLQQQDRRNED